MKAQKFTLLIVDDDENDRFFLEKTFHKLGKQYRIHAMSDAEEAIAYIKGEGKYAARKEFQFPSYIITDLKMTPKDGFHLLDHIKKHRALSINMKRSSGPILSAASTFSGLPRSKWQGMNLSMGTGA